MKTTNSGRPDLTSPSPSTSAMYGAGGSTMGPGETYRSVENTRDGRWAASVDRGSVPGSPRYGNLRTSARVPAMAAAADMAGLTRWVRPPPPCRPSKFRLDVDAHRSCGLSLSSFMARHMLHPGSRQSNPASIRILSNPSSSACFLTSPEPGTTYAWMPSATFRPFAIAAAARMSSMRPFVQLPMNALSMGTPSSFWLPSSPM